MSDTDAPVEVHLPAGHITADRLQRLAELAHTHTGGRLHLTGHGHLRLHGDPGVLTAAVTAAGLTVATPTRARLLASPLGARAGHHDITAVVRTVTAHLAEVEVPAGTVVGIDDGSGDIVALAPTVAVLAQRDGTFRVVREGTDTGARVVAEDIVAVVLSAPDAGPQQPAAPLPVPVPPPPPIGWFDHDGAVTLAGGLPGGVLPARLAEFLAAVDRTVVLTPWRSVLLRDLDEAIAEQVVRVLAPLGLVFDAASPHLDRSD